jgi:hypothetical protein
MREADPRGLSGIGELFLREDLLDILAHNPVLAPCIVQADFMAAIQAPALPGGPARRPHRTPPPPTPRPFPAQLESARGGSGADGGAGGGRWSMVHVLLLRVGSRCVLLALMLAPAAALALMLAPAAALAR